MSGYILRRLVQLIPVVLVSSFLVFMLLHLIPGDPAETVAGPDATPNVIAAVRHKKGLDRPLAVQYGIWLVNIGRGDLGSSYISRMPVIDLVGHAFPATIQLTIAALILSLIISLPTAKGWQSLRSERPCVERHPGDIFLVKGRSE
jgi:peptide/nickel transport system permease protein